MALLCDLIEVIKNFFKTNLIVAIHITCCTESCRIASSQNLQANDNIFQIDHIVTIYISIILKDTRKESIDGTRVDTIIIIIGRPCYYVFS